MANSFQNYDIPDPADVLGQEQDQTQKGLDSVNPNARNAALGALFSRVVNGDPRVQKAQTEQTAVATAQQNMQPQQDNESDIDYQIRRAHAVYAAVAPLDANAAQKAADNIVTLQQQKTQQRLLQTDIQDKEQTATIQRQTQGTFVVGSSDGTQEYGSVARFNDDGTPNPNFSSQLATLQQQNPGSQVATQQQWFANKAAVAAQKSAAAIQLANLKAALGAAGGADDPDVVRQLAGESVLTPNALSRQPAAMRNAVAKLKAVSGVTPGDELAAQLQMQFLKRSASASGARDGNIQILKNSVAGAGQLVLDAAQGLDRTRIQAINQAIVAGKTQFNDPAEKRYALAVQALTTEYARVISGGTGVTTDSARSDAYGLINTGLDLPSMKAAVDQISNKELGVVSNAADMTLESLGHPERYSAIMKIQKRLGIHLQADDGDGAAHPGDPDQTVATSSSDVTKPAPPVLPIKSAGSTSQPTLKARIDTILGK